MQFTIKQVAFVVMAFAVGFGIGEWKANRQFDDWKATLGIYGWPSAESVREVWIHKSKDWVLECHTPDQIGGSVSRTRNDQE